MKKIINLIFILFFVFPIVIATTVNLETGTILTDLSYNYTVNSNFNLNLVNVTIGEVYLDGKSFCSSGYINYFTTSRNCNTETVGNTGGSSSGGSYFISKKDCAIITNPTELKIDSQKYKLKIISNDINSFVLYYKLNSNNSEILEKVNISKSISKQFLNGTEDELIFTINSENLQGEAKLKITSSKCNDLELPININLLEKNETNLITGNIINTDDNSDNLNENLENIDDDNNTSLDYNKTSFFTKTINNFENNWLWYLASILIISAILYFMLFFNKQKLVSIKKKEPKFIHFIKSNVEKGIPIEHIRSYLIQKGYNSKEVDDLIEKIKTKEEDLKDLNEKKN